LHTLRHAMSFLNSVPMITPYGMLADIYRAVCTLTIGAETCSDWKRSTDRVIAADKLLPTLRVRAVHRSLSYPESMYS